MTGLLARARELYRRAAAHRSRVVGINRRNLTLVYPNNPRHNYPYADDKLLAKRCFAQAGVPSPETLAVCEGLFAVPSVVEGLRGKGQFVVKPANGSGGAGILVVGNWDEEREAWRRAGGREVTPLQLQRHLGDIIFGVHSNQLEDQGFVERRVVPHPFFSALWADGLCDVRVITLRTTPVMSMIRVPTAESGGRANLHQGGLGIALDLETGRTLRAVHHGRAVETHPESGAPLIGLQVPRWAEVVEVARRAAGSVPLGYLGIDVVIDAERGPLVLDRLWPMLTVMAFLIVGAVALQEFAKRRGNQTIRIVIHNEQSVAGEEDEAGADDGTSDAAGAPLSDLHLKARLMARRGLIAEALPIFAKVLAENPEVPALLGEVGFWLTVADEPELALPLLEKADRLLPSGRSALRLGNVRRGLDDLRGAEAEYRRALALQPSLGAAQIQLGTLLRRRGDLKEATAILEGASRAGSNEDRARALVALGATHLVAGRRPEAEKAFNAAIDFAPARAEVRLGVARAWLATGKAEDNTRALRVLGRAADLAPDLPAVWYALGRARERAGDGAGAMEAYDRVFRIDPSHRFARRRTIRLALQSRDFARARRDAERLLAEGPAVPEHHFLAALVADRDGRKDDARRAYRSAVAASKGAYPEAYLNLGLLEKGAGDVKAARDAYRKAIASRPNYTAAWLNLGRLEESAKRPAEAEAAWRKALEIDPKYAQAHLALGQLHSDQKRWEDAIADLRRALEVRPGYGAAELSLGVTLARAGRSAEAVQVYRQLVAREPRYVSAWFNLALALRRSEQPAEARSALQKAIELDASHVPSRRELGDLNLAEGRVAEAKALYQDALDLASGDPASRIALAQIAAREGDREGCLAAARHLRQEAPSDPRVQELPALCAAADGTTPR